MLSRIRRTDITPLLLVPVLCVCLCASAATNVQSNSHFSFYCDGYCNAFSALNRRARSCVVYFFFVGVSVTHKNVLLAESWLCDGFFAVTNFVHAFVAIDIVVSLVVLAAEE